MPSNAKRPCLQPGCNELATGGRCSQHQKLQPERSDEAKQWHRLYDRRWVVARKAFLSELCECNGTSVDCPRCRGSGLPNRFCNVCLGERQFVIATDVDHVIPHRGDVEKFWNRSNWVALCHRHHSRKTATEDGGFGNAPGS